MENKMMVVGYIYGDYYYKYDIGEFKKRFPELPFFNNEEYEKLLKDGKVSIDEEHDSIFRNFLTKQNNEANIEKIGAGGGGRHSVVGLNKLGVGDQIIYFDTCTKPSFLTGMEGIETYYLGMCRPCEALVIRTGNGQTGAGCLNIKSKRGDLDVNLHDKGKKKLERLLDEGYDVLINSISNNNLAKIITKKARSKVYSVITKYLFSDVLDDLMRRSNLLVFSGDEFYWVVGKEKKFEDLTKRGIDSKGALEIYKDINNFADMKRLGSSIVVTLGQYGAVYREPISSRLSSNYEGAWVRLPDELRKEVQEHALRNKKSANSSGDNFVAALINSLKKRKSMLDSIKDGCTFAVQTVLEFNHDRVRPDLYIHDDYISTPS